MLILLQLLQQSLDECLHGDYNLEQISTICLQLQTELPRAFKEYTDRALAEADFLRYHRSLVSLYACALDHGDPTVIASLGTLLRRQETLFSDLLPSDEPLPAFHLDELEQQIQAQLPPTLDKLRDKAVPPDQLAEIGHAVDALFTEGKPPVPTYHHRSYLPGFIGMLRQLADDPRPKKNWPRRFAESMVNYNFNYMGYFNRWKEQLREEIDQAMADGRAEEVLRELQETVQLYHARPTAFDPCRPSLKTLMETNLAHLWESLSASESNSHPLRTSILAGDLAVRFRYRFKASEFAYRTQREAARDFTRVHLIHSGQPVSPHSLTKFDKEALYGPALRYRRQLLAELKLIEKDFKFD